jgi:hypothetical protein
MSVFVAPGLPDHLAAQALGMPVYKNPVHTEPRYRPGLRGVRASLLRLDSVCSGHWEPLCSVLGDMAACLGIDADEVPSGPVQTSAVCGLRYQLNRAVLNRDLIATRDTLIRMLKVMKLGWRPSARWRQLYGDGPAS